MRASFLFYIQRLIVCSCILFALPVFVFAVTNVSGDISSSTTWTKAGSPYIVHGNTSVRSGVTLTIEQGVVVKFNATTSLWMEGTLNAQGTSANKIYFTSIKDDSAGGDTNGDGAVSLPRPRDWKAIYLTPGGTVNLDNAVIRYGGGGLCSICHGAGIFSAGRIYVLNSTISHNGLQGLFLFGGESTITFTDVSHQEYGFNLASAGVWNIAQNSIHDNSLFGIFNPSSSNIVDATSNFWGDASGPYHPVLNPTGTGNKVSNNVRFNPWLTEEPHNEPPPPSPSAECCSSVVFIPGLQATRLELDGNRLWEPNRNADVEKLFLDDNGNPLTAGIRTDGIIDEVVGFNIYKNFIGFMDELVATGTIKEWKPFPYDWRSGADDIINTNILLQDGTTYRMADELRRMADDSPTGKVMIITHSNGGLVAKALISKLQAEGHAEFVDKLIMVAAPQLGTPKAIAGILHGDEETIPAKIGIVLTKRTARELAENMSSAYTLLPSKKYFPEVFDPVIEFNEDVSHIYDFPALYGDAIDSRTELDSFLLGDGGARTEPSHADTDAPNVLDDALLSDAAVAQTMQDAWVAPAGVKVIQIAGWGLDTIRAIRYDDCDIPLCPDTLSNLDRQLILTHDGDGTVVIPSAVAMDIETYYVNLKEHNRFGGIRRNREHADIMEVETMHTILEGFIIDNIDPLPAFISTDKPQVTDVEKVLRFRIHSPVSLDLYDVEGNHTGLIQNQNPDSDLPGIEQELPNSYYIEFGDTKYAGADTFSTTTVVLIGQGTGTFTFAIDEVLGDNITASTSFMDIPVIEGARITTDVMHIASSTVLSIDVDGDGVVDAVVGPGEGVNVEELLGILRGTVRALNLAEKKEARILKTIDKLEKVLAKEYKNKTAEKQKTAHAFSKLEGLIEKFGKKGFLTTNEAEELLHIIGQIKIDVVVE